MHVISGPPASPYRRLVLDRDWRPVGPLNEWYRLRAGVGAPSTRDTYLRVLTPFFGFLLLNEWAWDAEPPLVREFTRAYLQAIGCVLRRDRERDGFTVAVTARAPLSPGSLALFLAAARDLYEVLIDGEWDAQTKAHRSYYAYANPMYSEVLRRWKRDHVRFVQNAGAPDWAGIRGENRSATQHRPVGYFRARGQIWQPRVAGEAKAVRVLIGAAIRYMIDVAPLRERVILRLLEETGARLHEILAMTAGGYRKGHSHLVGVRALLRNKGSLGREIKPVSFEAETDYLLHRYVRTERSRHDRERRTHIDDLRDEDPLFLSRRGDQLSDSGFRIHWKRLRVKAERAFRSAPVRLSRLTPHVIRHLHATERVALAAELAQGDRERQRAMVAAVQHDLFWQSSDTLQIYNHAIATAEAHEQLQTAYIDRVKSQPRTPRQAATAMIGSGSDNALADEAARRLERLSRLRSGGSRSW
jgi:site-specific recombinase XerD